MAQVTQAYNGTGKFSQLGKPLTPGIVYRQRCQTNCIGSILLPDLINELLIAQITYLDSRLLSFTHVLSL